jgi:two-component system, cell cycle response regulator
MDQSTLERILQSPNLPTLPAIAIRILELTQDDTVSMQELASTIQNDQAIAAKVLRTVNSSFYGLRRPCSTINQALVMLGISTVKTLALSFSLVSSLRRKGESEFDHATYWKRSLYTAAASRLIARAAKLDKTDEAFLGGLLQDVGMMAMYQSLGKEYIDVVRSAGDHRSLSRVEMTHLDIQHAQVGAMLAQRWKLPPELIIPIKYHEQPTAAPEEYAPLARAVGLGNIACDVLVSRTPGPALRRFHACASRWFNFSAQTCDDLLKEAAGRGRELSSLFVLNIGETESPEVILKRAEQQLAVVCEQTEQTYAQEVPFHRLISDSHEFDPLTGALTRRALITRAMELLDTKVQRAARVAVAALEIDRFSMLQSTLDQETADALLVETALLLEQHFSPEKGHVARWEQGTFVVLVPGSDADAMHHHIERVRQQLQEQAPSWFNRPGSGPVTWTAGVASVDIDPRTTTQQGVTAIGSALRALESARACGGDRTFLTPSRLAA